MKNTNLIIGRINSGKTRSLMFNKVKKIIDNNENLLILDNKEEYYKTFNKVLVENSYSILVFNLKDPLKSNSFNPLMLPYNYYKEGNKDKAVALVNELAIEIFKSHNPNADPYWENSSADYFTSLVLILFKEAAEEEVNFGSVLAMLSMGENKIDNLRIIDKYFSNLNVLDSIYITGSAIVYAPFETRSSIISVMKQKLNAYCMREQLLNNLAGNEIDLSNLNHKTAIFIIGNDSTNALANVLINQCVDYALYNNYSFNFILDNISEMPALLKLNQILDNKLKAYVLVRDKEILKDKYGKFIVSKFESVLEDYEANNFIEIEKNSDYPVAKLNDFSYFNFEEFIKKIDKK